MKPGSNLFRHLNSHLRQTLHTPVPKEGSPLRSCEKKGFVGMSQIRAILGSRAPNWTSLSARRVNGGGARARVFSRYYPYSIHLIFSARSVRLITTPSSVATAGRPEPETPGTAEATRGARLSHPADTGDAPSRLQVTPRLRPRPTEPWIAKVGS